jgi:hypothetical protein
MRAEIALPSAGQFLAGQSVQHHVWSARRES